MKVSTIAYHYSKLENRVNLEFPAETLSHWYLDYFREPCHVPDIDGNDVIAEPGTVWLSPPKMTIYTRYPDVSSYVHTSIIFDAEPDFITSLMLPIRTPVKLFRISEFEQLLFSLNECCISTSLFAKRESDLYLELILMFIHDELFNYDKQYTVKQGDDLQSLRSVVMNSLSIPWTVDSMAQRVHMSLRTFQRQYKKLYKKTPIADLYDMRFAKAKLLLEDNYSIPWILNSCCFKSAQHFSHFFKKRAGMTPSEYKKAFDEKMRKKQKKTN